jgi:hypothetical protein
VGRGEAAFVWGIYSINQSLGRRSVEQGLPAYLVRQNSGAFCSAPAGLRPREQQQGQTETAPMPRVYLSPRYPKACTWVSFLMPQNRMGGCMPYCLTNCRARTDWLWSPARITLLLAVHICNNTSFRGSRCCYCIVLSHFLAYSKASSAPLLMLRSADRRLKDPGINIAFTPDFHSSGVFSLRLASFRINYDILLTGCSPTTAISVLVREPKHCLLRR